MVTRPLLYLLLVVLAGACAYWSAVVSLGGLGGNPFAASTVEEVWPAPLDAAAHPFWGSYPALRGTHRGDQLTAWITFLGWPRDRFPHPAGKPAEWPRADRVFVHSLLWRLWRGKAFRSGGLELRLDREKGAPPLHVGAPSGLRLSMVAIDGSGRGRFPRDLQGMLEAGARLLLLSDTYGGLPWGPLPATDRKAEPGGGEPVSARRPVVLQDPRVAALPFRGAGRLKVRAILDLTHARIDDPRVPRGMWVSAPLELEVAKNPPAPEEAPPGEDG